MESFSSILESAFFERILHGQLRPGFLLGWAVMFGSSLLMCLWVFLHPDLHSNITLSGVAFCFGIGLIGSLIQTNTDVEDQEAGRYSQMGSGWNLWGDNIIFNKMGQFFLTILIVASFAASFYFFIESAHQEAEAKVTRVTPKSIVRVSTHPNSAVHHHKIEKAAHHQIEK
ncbi:MAG: hypothetical protein P4L53_05410 [Candidatus Obscuribacterales bacterium]|nr:hypothetical protein [Candidatus Obscuribacterales bacterium]